MSRFILATLLLVTAASVACSGTAQTSPSSIPTTPQAPKNVTLTFSGLAMDASALMSYDEAAFTVTVVSAQWSARTTYGNPSPFVQFFAEPGTTVAGEIRVSAGGSAFAFSSVDLYSSTTPIPYSITGLKGPNTVFELSGTVPNTFGNFMTVLTSNPSTTIDALSIKLVNQAAICPTCRNPMGLDNIVLTQ